MIVNTLFNKKNKKLINNVGAGLVSARKNKTTKIGQMLKKMVYYVGIFDFLKGELMKNKYQIAKDILEKNGQSRILSQFEKLNEENKEIVINQILNIDLENLKEMFDNIKKENNNLEVPVEPVKAIASSKLSNEEKNSLEQKAVEVIKQNKFAVVIMAGGQGSRLGFDGPKGTFSLELNGERKYLFEIIIDRLKDAKSKYGVYIPCVIMTSKENEKDTKKFFEEKNYFEYPKEKIDFFNQGESPILDEQGNLFIGEDGRIKFASDGNGSIFSSMKKENVLSKFKNNNIEWVFIGSVDNILLNPVDTLLLGVALDKKTEIATRTIIKNSPHEKVGVFCKREGKVKVIEYTEIPEEMVEAMNEDNEMLFGEAHIMCNLFSLKALEKASTAKLEYHVAHKKSKYMDENNNVVVPEKENSYKFEKFIFDAFELFDDITILRGNRENDFAPIKNATGIDSPETAQKLYEQKFKK